MMNSWMSSLRQRSVTATTVTSLSESCALLLQRQDSCRAEETWRSGWLSVAFPNLESTADGRMGVVNGYAGRELGGANNFSYRLMRDPWSSVGDSMSCQLALVIILPWPRRGFTSAKALSPPPWTARVLRNDESWSHSGFSSAKALSGHPARHQHISEG